jgi:hypothetical protein
MSPHTSTSSKALAALAVHSILCTCILCTCILTACSPKLAHEAGLNQLAERFQAANQAATIEPMLRLYCLDGCDSSITSRLKGALKFELGLPIEHIDFEPLTGADEESIEFTHNGTLYGPSLKPRYRMRVTYAVEDRFTSLFTVGQNTDGHWQIISAKPRSPLRY